MTIAALIIFVGFVILGIIKFGWQRSYSAFASKWTEAVPIDDHTHLWSIVTMVVAFLMAIPMIGSGEGSPWQFLGFFAPVYLGVVALTPEYETNKRQKVIHIVGTAVCALATLFWLGLVVGDWKVLVLSFIAAYIVAIVTKTIERSLLFWSEMAMFAAVFIKFLA